VLSHFLKLLSGYFFDFTLQSLLPSPISRQVSLRSQRSLSLLTTCGNFRLLALGGGIRGSLERLLKVGDDVVDMLDTD
jgi:hypothetical protein